MAKRTAVIDIGSNSARMVVFEKSSHLAFHLIKEVKSRVRIGEGAYENNGILQDLPMQRAYKTIESFKHIINTLKCKKILCVATSALRDAPNSSVFIKTIRKNLGIHIKIIDGNKEAYLGAVAAVNHLMPLYNATTLDIGGGSSELALIKNGKITDTISLNIGTVRLKELFLDKKASKDEIYSYINSKLKDIPESFKNKKLIVIGGTTRSLSKIIMKKIGYPLETVHGFEYKLEEHIPLIKDIINSDTTNLKTFNIKKDRIDTIKEGLYIFEQISNKLETKKVITSGVGVREGLYLTDILRNHNHMFPKNFKLSLRSMCDRFEIEGLFSSSVSKTVQKLFDALFYLHQIDDKYKPNLIYASKLYNIGVKLNFYQKHLHSFYFILNNLNYGFSHKDKILIAILIKYHTKKLPSYDDIKAYEKLLPKVEIVNWLSFILSLSECLHKDLLENNFEFKYENHTLHIKSDRKIYLTKECIKRLDKPASFAIHID